MGDRIYMVDVSTKELTGIEPVSFEEIGIRERQDLEAWVISHPEILGEELLILTCEFDRFDKASRRLDVLALDKEGALVVVELKLELSGNYADQQAIRYAAMCSTMTIDQVVQEFARFGGLSQQEATDRILGFLGGDELPILNDRPRIILAAGSLDDIELTSTVLWLRKFGVDITCVELTPYPHGADNKITLVPRTIIPIPEARDYLIGAEVIDHGQRPWL